MIEQSERMSEELSLEWLANFPDINTDLQKLYKQRMRIYAFSPSKSSKIPLAADKAVQTDPELNVSPSWMISTESELCKLHTKVRNMINRLHDTPDGYFNREIGKMYDNLFTYVGGNWQSISHPEVKFPASGVTFDRFKYELKDLMTITSRLRDGFPYVAEQQRGSLFAVGESGNSCQKVYTEVCKKAGYSNAKPCIVGSNPGVEKPYGAMASCSKCTETDFNTIKPYSSSQSTPSSCKEFNIKKKYPLVPFRRALVEFNEAASVFPGSKCIKGSLTKNMNADKIVGNQENKVAAKANVGNRKDFIKRNILAVKSSVVVSRKRIR